MSTKYVCGDVDGAGSCKSLISQSVINPEVWEIARQVRILSTVGSHCVEFLRAGICRLNFMILNWKKRSWSPNSRLIGLLRPEYNEPDCNRVTHEIKWRPISNLDERDPQLKLHILQGTFDGATATQELKRSDRNPRETSCCNWDVKGSVRGKQKKGNSVRKSRASVWSKLSADLLESVLIRLPYKSQVRFQSVCREWRDTLSSTRFAHQTAALEASTLPLICTFEYLGPNREEPDVYGPQEYIPDGALELAETLHNAYSKSHQRKIHGMDLSFAPSWIIGNRMTATRDGILLSFSKTSLRCSGPSSGHGGMCLLNPFTRTWRELPKIPSGASELFWTDDVMVDRKLPSHYKAVVLMGAGDGNQWSVYQFSSRTDEWRVTAGDVPADIPLDAIGRRYRYLSQAYLFTEDLLYIWRGNPSGDLLIHSLNDGSLVSMSTVGYPELSADTMNWRFLKVHLVEYDGEIYGGWLLSGWRPRHPGFMFGISKLDTKSMKWGELALLPMETLECKLGALERSELETGMDYRPREWKFYEHKAVVVLGDYICVNITSDHGSKGVNIQYVGGYHIPSSSWQSFDFHDPYVSGLREFELFEPKCLYVHL
ncbi:hypothetical protein R1flu_022408 [Riccia fluitans]|uniref:F-box domain-containing protein n=1 Tax=Riccia fluitans TaxID=41844 RepID=A0ABD1ZSC2_9MARC